MKKKVDQDKPIAAALETDGFIILKGTQPCTIENISGKRKGGVLRPATVGEFVARFLKKRDARRAIDRTENCTMALRGSMVEEWARVRAPFRFVAGEFTVQPLGRQV